MQIILRANINPDLPSLLNQDYNKNHKLMSCLYQFSIAWLIISIVCFCLGIFSLYHKATETKFDQQENNKLPQIDAVLAKTTSLQLLSLFQGGLVLGVSLMCIISSANIINAGDKLDFPKTIMPIE